MPFRRYEILVTNRTRERAEDMADSVRGGIIAYESLQATLPEVDIVITSSGAPDFILTKDQMRKIIDARKNRPMFLIDIAVPRNIDPAVNESGQRFSLRHRRSAKVVDTNLRGRLDEAAEADKIVMEEVDRLEAWTPTVLAFWYSLTRWTLFDAEFIGLDNFAQFFREPALTSGLRNTIVYAVVTSGLKVILGLLSGGAPHLEDPIAPTSFGPVIFFPVLVSTVAVGITFAVLLHPSNGLVNIALEQLGIDGPQWLGDPDLALLSVALVDVWKGIGIALVIFIAAILSIPEEYNDAVRLEGGAWTNSGTSRCR